MVNVIVKFVVVVVVGGHVAVAHAVNIVVVVQWRWKELSNLKRKSNIIM